MSYPQAFARGQPRSICACWRALERFHTHPPAHVNQVRKPPLHAKPNCTHLHPHTPTMPIHLHPHTPTMPVHSPHLAPHTWVRSHTRPHTATHGHTRVGSQSPAPTLELATLPRTQPPWHPPLHLASRLGGPDRSLFIIAVAGPFSHVIDAVGGPLSLGRCRCWTILTHHLCSLGLLRLRCCCSKHCR